MPTANRELHKSTGITNFFRSREGATTEGATSPELLPNDDIEVNKIIVHRD